MDAPPDGPARIVDLSIPLRTGMTVFPGDPEVEIASALTLERDLVNVLRVHMGSQTGTHLDAPFHVLAGGARLDELPLERFLGPAVVADVRHLGADAPIGWDDLGGAREALRPGAVLLVHTGCSSRFDDYPRYRAHPWLRPDTMERVVAAGVLTVGIDALNVDPTPENLTHVRFDAHRPILEAGGVIVENLTNLDAVGRLTEPIVSVLPLHLPGADGGPVRAVAYER